MTETAPAKQDPPRRKLADDERGGLPWWTYFSEELLELEKEELFRKTWQLACHVSDVPKPGDYRCFDIVGERGLVVRGHDNVVRAFHNVCRHRGSRVVAKEAGSCKRAIVCPFHGWSYNLDGTLRSVTARASLPQLDPHEHGLPPLEHEIWQGFVFVRFVPGDQPPVAELFARHMAELAGYGIDGVEPLTGFMREEMNANWKAVRDVDNEGYHVPIAHPGLQDLYGSNYVDEKLDNGTTRSFGQFRDPETHRLWSVRLYAALLPERRRLLEANKRAWLYIGLVPNMVMMFYPDCIGFYQEFPLAIGRTVQRSAYYARPDERREMKAARYLSQRIDRLTSAEDAQLIEWSWEAMQSSAFKDYILSDLEAGVRDYHEYLRAVLPVMRFDDEPDAGTLAGINRQLRSPRSAWPWPAADGAG